MKRLTSMKGLTKLIFLTLTITLCCCASAYANTYTSLYNQSDLLAAPGGGLNLMIYTFGQYSRVFIPPGTIGISMTFIGNVNALGSSVSRFGRAPDSYSLPVPDMGNGAKQLDAARTANIYSTGPSGVGIVNVVTQNYYTPLSADKAGWFYMDAYMTAMQYLWINITVDVTTYTAWYNTGNNASNIDCPCAQTGTCTQPMCSGSTPTNYTVNFTPGAGGYISSGSTSQTVASGSTTTAVTATAYSGYTFSKWTNQGGYVVATTATLPAQTVTSNMTYTANFTAISNNYNVTFAAGTGGYISSGSTSQTVASSSQTTAVTATANSGYTFSKWTNQGGYVVATTATLPAQTITSAMTYTANFTAGTPYTVSFTAGTGGYISLGNTAQAVTSGSSTTAVTATANSGYTFTNWTNQNGTVVATTATIPAQTITSVSTYTANFTPITITYTVNFTAGNGGYISMGNTAQAVANGGSTTPVTATANSGYTFVNWTLNGTQVGTTAILQAQTNITANATYIANFTVNSGNCSSQCNPWQICSNGTCIYPTQYEPVEWTIPVTNVQKGGISRQINLGNKLDNTLNPPTISPFFIMNPIVQFPSLTGSYDFYALIADYTGIYVARRDRLSHKVFIPYISGDKIRSYDTHNFQNGLTLNSWPFMDVFQDLMNELRLSQQSCIDGNYRFYVGVAPTGTDITTAAGAASLYAAELYCGQQ